MKISNSLAVYVLCALAIFAEKAHAQKHAIKADKLYTSEGPMIANGVLLLNDGKIEAVGTQAAIPIPEGYILHEAAVVTPGFIDAHSVVGLAGIFNQKHDQDQLEKSNPIQPELRAIDAYNAREELVRYLRGFGITTVNTGHGPGALVSGQTMVVKTAGETVDEALIDPFAMVAMTIGSSVADNFEKPGTRAKGVSMLREAFVAAQIYKDKMQDEDLSKRPDRDLAKEALLEVLNGEVPALITAQSARDIITAIRLRDEFGFKLIIDGGAEAYSVIDELVAAKVPVVVHPTMVRNYGDTRHATYTCAARLHEAGIPIVFQSGFEGYVPKTRVVTFEAALAVANGLDYDAAMQALTIEAARLLGVDHQVGSLKPGKDADIALYDGDPFEYTSHVLKVFIDGILVSDEAR
jgi:imidazolonepropionase-like amidohydrolase